MERLQGGNREAEKVSHLYDCSGSGDYTCAETNKGARKAWRCGDEENPPLYRVGTLHN